MKPAVLEGFAVSPEQQWTWLQQERDGAADGYRAECALALDGLDRDRVAAALARAVERHEILRTRFERLPGLKVPVQVVDAAPPARPLDVWAAAGEDDAALAEAFARLRAPAEGPALRAAFVEGARRTALCLSLPALCADAGTLRLLARELAAAPSAAAAEPDEAPLQYADVATWLNELREARPAGASGDATEGMRLPWMPEPGAAFRPGRAWAPLPAGLPLALEAIAAGEGASGPALFFACWQVWLARLADVGEVVVGAAAEARRFPELAGALGPLTRYLPVRQAVDLRRPFRDALRSAEAGLRAASSWESYCGWEGGAPGAVAAAPRAATFTCEDGPGAPPPTVLSCHAHGERSVLGLVVHRGPTPGLALHYDASCVEAAEAARLVAQVARSLHRVPADPGAPAGRLLAPDAAERARLTVDFNRTQVSRSAPSTLPALFEAQAARDPEAPAVLFEGAALSFGALNRRANRLAHALRRRGVRTDLPVLLCAERSIERLVAALAVLKAGGGYVPLDPANPPERLAAMVEDARAPLALADAGARALLAGRGVVVAALDEAEREAEGESEDDPAPLAEPGSLAYVIYTSGSTGRPKGVMVAHEAIVNRILWGQDVYPMGPGDRVLQTAAFGFDFSVWETFAPLATGAAVVLPRPDGHRDSGYLVRLISREQVTTAHFVPSMLQVFLEEADIRSCGNLRRVFCGGEALPAPLARRFMETLPDTALFNQYGPTETTVDSTFHLCASGTAATSVPIGRPVANTQAYVLDEDLRLSPEGTVGELCLGGAGLARGYLGRPDLTAAAFVPDPHGPVPGARLYRTGDLVRHRPDGNLDFLGRRDQQVKVRGARIEVGEIESRLLEHPAVREAAVALDGDSSLAAYVVCAGGAAATADLRAFLSARLPDYMVPSRFAYLEALPRTATGKVDRRALPAPGAVARPAETAFVEPCTPLEARLAAVFAAVLKLERVGRHDDFFQLGGHSLLAMRLVSRLREALSTEVPLRSVFEAPTVAGLAAVVEAGGAAAALPEVTRVPRGDGPCAFPLSHGQEHLWLFEQVFAGTATYNVPVALRLRGPLDATVMERSLELLAARHEALRTTYGADSAGTPRQVVAPAAALRLTRHDLAGPNAEARALALATDAARVPFDLTRGPLLRASLYRLDVRDHVLLLVTHHIAFDGWSLALLVEELGAAYRALLDGAAPALAESPLQYADYAVWQRRHVAGPVLERHLDYWRGRLRDAPATALPVDRPARRSGRFRGGRETVVLPAALGAALRALGQGAGATLFMTLLAGFAALVRRYTGQGDVVLLSSVANRDRRELERVVGFLVNLVALRVDVAHDPSFAALLSRVRETTLGAYAHQDVPFASVVEALRPARAVAAAPFSRLGFTLQAGGGVGPDFGPVAVAPFAVEGGSSKTDLTLMVAEDGDLLHVTAEYDVDLFQAATVRRLLGHYGALLAAAAAAPAAPLSMLEPEPGCEPLVLVAAPQAPAVEAAEAAEAARPEPDLAARSNLTRSQLLFWLGQKLHAAAPLFNMVTTFTLRGPVDEAALVQAVEAVVHASDALRTVVREVGGVPLQGVEPWEGTLVERVDLTAGPHRRAVEDWVAQRAAHPLPLSRPVDVALLTTAPGVRVLYLAHHHVVADGWSTGLVWRQVAQAYERARVGTLEPLALPAFHAFVAEERAWRETGRRGRAAAYWNEKLARPLAPLSVYGRPQAQPATQGRRVRRALGVARLSRLRALAAAHAPLRGGEDLALLGFFGAALAAFLNEASGERRLAIGLVHHNRYTRPLAETIGMIIEILPLHVTVDAGDSFLSLAEKVCGEAVTALKHGRHPVANAVNRRAWHALLNYIGRAPLPALGGVPVEVDWVHTGYQDEALAVHVLPAGSAEDLVVNVDWDRALLGPDEAEEAGGRLIGVLDAGLAEPDRPLAETVPQARLDGRAAALSEEIGFDF